MFQRSTEASGEPVRLMVDLDDGTEIVAALPYKPESKLLVGGSDETHGRMTETMMKTFEELKRRHKQLAECEPQEIADIIANARPR